MDTVSVMGYMPANDFGESGLIRAAQQGDAEAFEQLVRPTLTSR